MEQDNAFGSTVVNLGGTGNVNTTNNVTTGNVTSNVQVTVDDVISQQREVIAEVEREKMEETTVENVEETTKVVEENIINEDFTKSSEYSITIPTSNLKRMINMVKKIATSDIQRPISEAVYIVADENGLTFYADNEHQNIEVKDRTVKATTPFSISVSADKFIKNVSTYTGTTTKMVYDEATTSLSMITPTGTYRFAQKTDLGTGMVVVIKPTYDVSNVTMTQVNYEEMRSAIQRTKVIRGFTPDVRAKGIYFTDIVISTDLNVLLMQQGINELSGSEFFLSSAMADLVVDLPFDATKFKVGLIADKNAIVFSDDVITISSQLLVNEDGRFVPVENSRKFWNQEYSSPVTINTAECMSALKRLEPFIEPGKAGDCATCTIQGNILSMSSAALEGIDRLIVNNTQNYNITFKLPILRFIGVLQTINTATFNMTFNLETNSYVCFEYENIKCILSTNQE